jgi:hypothetical protein
MGLTICGERGQNIDSLWPGGLRLTEEGLGKLYDGPGCGTTVFTIRVHSRDLQL